VTCRPRLRDAKAPVLEPPVRLVKRYFIERLAITS